jgi:mono/diheme cytochrome c family protein
VLPVQADVAPSRLEAKLLGSALHAAVARHAPSGPNPMPSSEENLISGAKVYRDMCLRCHGGSRESDNSYGRSFYPPAPQLPLIRTSYTDSEMFWIVKHGIRNTAMPARGNLLSDEEIWQVVTAASEIRLVAGSIKLPSPEGSLVLDGFSNRDRFFARVDHGVPGDFDGILHALVRRAALRMNA